METTKNRAEEMRRMKIEILTELSFEYARRKLWCGHSFSEKETREAKKYIRLYYEEILPALFNPYSEAKRLEFEIRIDMAFDFVKRKSGRYVTHPVIWFNPNNKFGFAGTHEWYVQDMEQFNYSKVRFYNDEGRLVKKVA